MLPVMNCKLVNKNMKHPGIYIIYNLRNCKFYIGSSVNVYSRIKNHFNQLKLNNHINKHLQNAYNLDSKYFIAFLLENLSSEESLLIREQFWIDELNACKDGYNILPVAGSTLGYKHSEEVKKKISLKTKGLKKSEEYKLSRTGLKASDETKSKISNSHKGLKHSDEAKKKISEIQYIPVNQLSLDGKLIKTWESLTTAQNEGGFDKRHISKCCHGKRKTHGGFMWEFA